MDWYVPGFLHIQMLAGTLNHVTLSHSEVTPLFSSSFEDHDPPVISVICHILRGFRLYDKFWTDPGTINVPYGCFLLE